MSRELQVRATCDRCGAKSEPFWIPLPSASFDLKARVEVELEFDRTLPEGWGYVSGRAGTPGEEICPFCKADEDAFVREEERKARERSGKARARRRAKKEREAKGPLPSTGTPYR